MKSVLKMLLALTLVVTSVGFLASCGEKKVDPATAPIDESVVEEPTEEPSEEPSEDAAPDNAPSEDAALDPSLGAEMADYEVGTTTTENGDIVKNPLVTIEMENGGKIVVELLPEYAPNTVKNFVSLVGSGFYDGVVFHRIIPNFMIQGGDPTGTGMGGPDYSIVGEFTQNGFEANTLSHTEGVISMARSGHPDSAGSQFFICDSDEATFLDGQYTAFGKVVSGIDLVKAIALEPSNGDMATTPRVMKSVTVDTFGHEWGEPEKVPAQ